MTKTRILVASFAIIAFVTWDLFFKSGYNVYIVSKNFNYWHSATVTLNDKAIGKVSNIETVKDSAVVLTLSINHGIEIPADALVSYREDILGSASINFQSYKNQGKDWKEGDTIAPKYMLVRNASDTVLRVLTNGLKTLNAKLDSIYKDSLKRGKY